MSKNNMKAWKAPSQSGGSHFFGGGHAPKAPKGFGGHVGGGGHGGGGVPWWQTSLRTVAV